MPIRNLEYQYIPGIDFEPLPGTDWGFGSRGKGLLVPTSKSVLTSLRRGVQEEQVRFPSHCRGEHWLLNSFRANYGLNWSNTGSLFACKSSICDSRFGVAVRDLTSFKSSNTPGRDTIGTHFLTNKCQQPRSLYNFKLLCVRVIESWETLERAGGHLLK